MTKLITAGLICLLAGSNARILKSKGAKTSKGSKKNSNSTVSCVCDANGVNVSSTKCFEIPGSIVICDFE